MRYVLEEQEKVQKVWDLRHRALKSDLEVQLAHGNQMRVSIGKMYTDLRRATLLYTALSLNFGAV